MSLDYEHLFSQIDKAKKKRGNYWNTPAAKKLREQHEKDQADKKRRSDEYIATHSSPGKKQVSEKLTRVAGRKRGGGKYNVGTEQKTRDTNRGRGKDNLRTIAERKEYDRMRNVDEKIRAGMTAIPFGHTNERDYKNTLSEMRDAKQAQRNQDNRIARERKAARARQGETSDEYHKRIAASKKKKKQKKQTKQQAADAKEEKYDFEKDKTPGKIDWDDEDKEKESGGFVTDEDVYGTDDDKGDYKNASVWKSWLEKKECPNCGKKIKGKKTKLLWDFITHPYPDIYPSQIKGREDDEEEVEKSLWKSWLKNKEQEIVEVDGKTTLREKEPTIVEEKNRKFAKWKKQLEGTKDYLGQSAQKAWLEKTQPSKTKPTGKWTCPHCKHNEMLGGKGTPETFRAEMEAMRDSVPEFNADVAETGITDKTIEDNVKQYIYHQKHPDIVHNSKTGKWRGHGQKDVHDYGNTQQENKSEEGIGQSMLNGAQRGLGHEASYKQDSGQSAQITEVVEEEIGNESKKKSHIEKDGRNIHGYPHGKCTRCGHYMESEEYQTAEHSFNNPKEGEKVCNDCFDQEQSEFEGEEPKVFGNQSDSTISHTDPKKDKKKSHKCPKCESKDLVSAQHKSKKEKRGHNTKICDDCGHEWENKSAYENHEQDEGPEVKPNKQQTPPSKPGMDVIRSTYKKALITKYNNIYKPANI